MGQPGLQQKPKLIASCCVSSTSDCQIIPGHFKAPISLSVLVSAAGNLSWCQRWPGAISPSRKLVARTPERNWMIMSIWHSHEVFPWAVSNDLTWFNHNQQQSLILGDLWSIYGDFTPRNYCTQSSHLCWARRMPDIPNLMASVLCPVGPLVDWWQLVASSYIS